MSKASLLVSFVDISLDCTTGIDNCELIRCLFRFGGVMIFLNRFQKGILFDDDSSDEFIVERVIIGTVVAVDAARDPVDDSNWGESDGYFCRFLTSFSSLLIFDTDGRGNGAWGW